MEIVSPAILDGWEVHVQPCCPVRASFVVHSLSAVTSLGGRNKGALSWRKSRPRGFFLFLEQYVSFGFVELKVCPKQSYFLLC